ncbi:hypothetical protein ABAZ39_16595 (plasmid) [Azospirillum argentinense]|uniref:DUF4376 domain-containing protein n=1 Tax=Azospirillum argentinense TaxID=2970906 RepID=A0A060DHB8_9PROT|nr:hypothetical protein [Azospirillum argentinense]AIB13561.1 hypothetical protein ABAZ39_16595 [Azospirillum argentinense]EZQ06540.1 hypothetical protein ABAZ39_21530 [Azospirillum argentinense]
MQPDQMPDSYKGGRLLYRWQWVQLHPAVLDPETGGELEPAVFGARCPEPPLDVFDAAPEEIETTLLTNAEVRALVAAALPPGLPSAPPAPLGELKAAAVDLINARVGELRAQHITVTVGQSATYLEKQEEAEQHAAGDSGPFPYLAAEAAATDTSLDDIAALVGATAAAWTAVNADLEGKRRAAVEAVKAAETHVQVFQACTHLRA